MFAFGDKQWPGLAKLNEESGELVQVIGKLMMTHGEAKHWDGSDLRERLIEEMADGGAASLFVEYYALTAMERARLEARRSEKYALFEKWHKEQAEKDQPEAETLSKRYEDAARALSVRGSEIDALQREKAALVRALGERYEDVHRALAERNGEVVQLKREHEALVRALGQKGQASCK